MRIVYTLIPTSTVVFIWVIVFIHFALYGIARGKRNIIDAFSIPFNVFKQALYSNDKCKKKNKNPPKLTYRQDLVNDS